MPRQITCAVFGAFLSATLSSVVGTAAESEQSSCALWRQKVQNKNLPESSLLGRPITDETLMGTIATIRVEIAKTPDVHTMPSRHRYIKDLLLALELSEQQDGFRLRDLSSFPGRSTHGKLADRTVARAIRCLGDLRADEAATAIAEFLLLPPDVESHSSFPRDGDIASRWALLQIGDPALPALRAKMVGSDRRIRAVASWVVWDILGPWALDSLDQWIHDAKTPEERDRLNEPRRAFVLESLNREFYASTEDYRRERLREVQKRLDLVLDHPTTGTRK